MFILKIQIIPSGWGDQQIFYSLREKLFGEELRAHLNILEFLILSRIVSWWNQNPD
jgi:hypothetical protein